MTTTYEYKYDVKTIYDTFKNNRINVVSYLGTSNNGKSGANSSAYLSYVNNFTDTYIYARKSSPSIDSDTDKNYAYLKVGNTTYNFYHGHAYTYTETVTGNGVKPILIAYDFVNQISTTLKFDKVSINHTATPINDIPQTVNVFSPVSYIIENTSNNTSNSVGPKDEYSISRDEINKLLNGKTFADFTTYVSYSYLNSKKGDGIVYEDGKDTLSADPINDIHVWSLSDGVNMKPHAYVDNDETAVNPTVKLNIGQRLKDAITHDANFSTHFSYRYNYDTNYVLSNVSYNTSNNTYYLQMGNQTFKNFYKNSYAYYKGNYTNNTFGYCYTWPATRWNKQSYDFYETVYVKSKLNVSDYDSNENNDNNVNTACYISSISKLPVGLLYCNSNEGTYIPINSYIYGGMGLNKAPDRPNGIDHYTFEFSYKMINSNGTLSDDTYTLTVKSSTLQSFQYDVYGNKLLYPADTASFYIDSPYFKVTQQEAIDNISDNTYGKVLYWSTNLYCPSNFLDNKIVTGLNIKAWTYGSYLLWIKNGTVGSPGGNIPMLDIPCTYKTSTNKGLDYKYSRGSASHLGDEYYYTSDPNSYFYYGCEITPSDPLNVRIESINIKFYIKSNI